MPNKLVNCRKACAYDAHPHFNQTIRVSMQQECSTNVYLQPDEVCDHSPSAIHCGFVHSFDNDLNSNQTDHADTEGCLAYGVLG
jgi:hypothetical protein